MLSPGASSSLSHCALWLNGSRIAPPPLNARPTFGATNISRVTFESDFCVTPSSSMVRMA